MNESLENWSKPDEGIITALERLFEQKKLVLISFFLANPDKEFNLSEIHESTKIPLATLHRYLKVFVSADILRLHEIKNLKLYSLKKNSTTLFLSKFIGIKKKSPLQEFIDRVSKIPGVSYIIRYGKEEDKKVNIQNSNFLALSSKKDNGQLVQHTHMVLQKK